MQTVLFLDESLPVQANSIFYGGIEMFSRKTPIDLNDMIINLELLTGDPSLPDVDVEMSWNLKPITALREPPNSNINAEYSSETKTVVGADLSQIDSTTCNVNNTIAMDTSYQRPKTAAPTSTKVGISSKVSNENMGSHTFTLGLGEHIYTCRKSRRNKNKHTKKG